MARALRQCRAGCNARQGLAAPGGYGAPGAGVLSNTRKLQPARSSYVNSVKERVCLTVASTEHLGKAASSQSHAV